MTDSKNNAQYDDIMFTKILKNKSIKRRLLSISSPRPLVILSLVLHQLLQHQARSPPAVHHSPRVLVSTLMYLGQVKTTILNSEH